MVASTTLLLYMEKIKNIGIMKTLSKVEKNMVCLNVLSFLLKSFDPWELLFYPHYIWSHHRCSHCIWKIKNIYTMYNLFKRWEKYRICERSFIFIEIIGFHGNYYFTLITYGRVYDALTVYEKIKNIGIMKTLSKVEKNMVYLNILSFS